MRSSERHGRLAPALVPRLSPQKKKKQRGGFEERAWTEASWHLGGACLKEIGRPDLAVQLYHLESLPPSFKVSSQA